MVKKIKLIWEIRGPEAIKTAEHHTHHLTEYLEDKKLKNRITGTESFTESFALAFMVVDEDEMIQVRDDLKPTRGEWYDETES